MVTIIKTVALTPTGLEYRTAKLFIYFLNGKKRKTANPPFLLNRLANYPVINFVWID